jgi:hypothetical protein
MLKKKSRTLTNQLTKLNTLEAWLNKRGFTNEAHKVMLIKTAISFDEAKDRLENSKAVVNRVKGLAWDESVRSMKFSAKEIEDISESYKEVLLSYIPNDLEDGQRGTALQWLISLGKKNIEFAEKIYTEALTTLGAVGQEWTRLMHLIESRGPTALRNFPLKSSIEKFFHWNRFMEIKDLYSIRSIGELAQIVEAADPAIKDYQEKKQYLDAEQGTEALMDNAAHSVYAIHNKGAACEIGKGTEWCTAAPGLDYFEQYYHPQDPLFVILIKSSQEKFQVHYGSKQFQNEHDESVDSDTRNSLHQILSNTDAKNYLSFKTYEASDILAAARISEVLPSDKEVVEIIHNVDEFYNIVIGPKLREGVDDAEHTSELTDSVAKELAAMVGLGLLIKDDNELSDKAADYIARHTPDKFFELSLHIDYPEMARKIIKDIVNQSYLLENETDGSTGTRRRLSTEETYSSAEYLAQPFLNLFHLLNSGNYIEALDEDQQKEVAKILLKENASKIIFAPHATPQSNRFKEVSRLTARSRRVWENYQSNHELFEQILPNHRRALAETIIDEFRGKDDVLYPLSEMIDSNFSIEFPDLFEEALRILVRKGLHGRSSEAINTLLKKFEEGSSYLAKKYLDTYFFLLKQYAIQDFVKFKARYVFGYGRAIFRDLSLSLPEEQRPDFLAYSNEIQTAGQSAFIDQLYDAGNRIFEGWKHKDATSTILHELHRAGEAGYNPNLPGVLMGDLYFKQKLISLISTSLNNGQSLLSYSPNRQLTKVELHDDILLYIATFYPDIWETSKLDLRSSPSEETKQKARRSASNLQNAITSSDNPPNIAFPETDHEDEDEDEKEEVREIDRITNNMYGNLDNDLFDEDYDDQDA